MSFSLITGSQTSPHNCETGRNLVFEKGGFGLVKHELVTPAGHAVDDWRDATQRRRPPTMPDVRRRCPTSAEGARGTPPCSPINITSYVNLIDLRLSRLDNTESWYDREGLRILARKCTRDEVIEIIGCLACTVRHRMHPPSLDKKRLAADSQPRLAIEHELRRWWRRPPRLARVNFHTFPKEGFHFHTDWMRGGAAAAAGSPPPRTLQECLLRFH